MKLNYFIAFILAVIFVLPACINSKKLSDASLGSICRDSTLRLSVERIDAISADSIVVELLLINECKDSVIIMQDYTKPIFYFPNGGIQSNPIQTTLLYPSIDWDKSSKNAKEIYIKNRCTPLINQYRHFTIPPNGNKTIIYNLVNLGYRGFAKNIQYDFVVSFDVSNQIKSYCPFIWSGFTKSPTYSFLIK